MQDIFWWLIPTEYIAYSYELWLPVFLWMMIGITFAILTRRQEITMPSRIGSKIKPGTIGQYVITFCLSFFFQAFGVIPIAAGLYAGAGGTVANQLQKVITSKMSQVEMEDKLREMIADFEDYKEYTKHVEDDRERRVMNRLLQVMKRSPEDLGGIALRLLGLGDSSEAIADVGVEVIEQVMDRFDKDEPEPPIVVQAAPVQKMEMSVQEAKDLLKKAQKKSIFSR
jgi:hypothetical protein